MADQRTYGGAPGKIPAQAWTEVGEHVLGETPGVKAVLLRGLDGAPVQRNGVAVAAQQALLRRSKARRRC